MGRGPEAIRAHFVRDLLLIRMTGVLTSAERQLVRLLSAEKGRDLLKEVRTHLIETARPVLDELIFEVTGIEVLSMHHDISTVTGEELIVFTLSKLPTFRQTNKWGFADSCG